MDSCLASVLPVIVSEIGMNVLNDSGSSHF